MRGADRQLVLAIGVASGVGLALRGLGPTGSTVIDWILLLVTGAAVVWAAASAPWWALAGAAGIAAAIAEPWLASIVGLAALALSLAVGVTRRSQPLERAAVAGVTLLVLSNARELRWFGVSSAVAIGVGAVLVVLGLRRRSRRERRLAYAVGGGVALVMLFGAVVLVVAGSSARRDLTVGNDEARQGLSRLQAADFDAARGSFERAAEAFERASGDLGAAWVLPARLVPVVSQHHRAVDGLASEAADATATVADQLGRIDFDALRLVDGRIDIDAVRSLQGPMTELTAALASLDEVVADAEDPWLVGPVSDRLTDLRLEIAEQRELGDKAVVALERAPAILGADGPRTYFVMFTTPAEARGQGGFMGNFAEITADDGRLELTDFGRTRDLTTAAEGPFDLSAAPADWLAQYGGEGGREVTPEAWSIFTISPHFPSTGRVTDLLYGQSGGSDLDGVINLDVFALQALVGVVGDIAVDGRAEPLDGRTTAQYLLVEQYETEDKDVRVDQLELIAREVTDRLLGAGSPEPLDLGRALAPMVRERRVMAWMERPDEQALVTLVGLDGAVLGSRGGRDAVTVAINNDGSGKMDTYLAREMSYASTPDGDELTVTITHAAPVDALPDEVATPPSGLPRGWGRWLVTTFSTRQFAEAWLDGEPIGLDVGEEAGLSTGSIKLVLAPGGSATLRLRFLPSLQPDQTQLVVQPQPLVQPERWSLFGDEPRALATTTVVAR